MAAVVMHHFSVLAAPSVRSQGTVLGGVFRIELKVKKGRKDLIKAHAESKGESINGFVNRAINETMEREKSDQ